MSQLDNTLNSLKLGPCHSQPCFERPVLVLLPMMAFESNTYDQARFFCTEHGKGIRVVMTAKHEGYIIAVVKEPNWQAWENRDESI